MEGDTNTNSNPNETILIPLLNKRISELYTASLLLEAKLQWADQEKSTLIAEIGGKTQRILDLEHAEPNKIEAGIAAARTEWEREKSNLTDSLNRERESVQEKIAAVQTNIEAEKRQIAQNWQNELAVQTGVLRGQIAALTEQLATANSTVSLLKSEIEAAKAVVPVDTSKRKGKKEAAVMGGGTF